jgi:hypothetical protein
MHCWDAACAASQLPCLRCFFAFFLLVAVAEQAVGGAHQAPLRKPLHRGAALHVSVPECHGPFDSPPAPSTPADSGHPHLVPRLVRLVSPCTSKTLSRTLLASGIAGRIVAHTPCYRLGTSFALRAGSAPHRSTSEATTRARSSWCGRGRASSNLDLLLNHSRPPSHRAQSRASSRH